MRLTHLSLYRFRTFPELDLDLPGGLLLFHGHNGAGKSNLLEACYLLAITKSYRAGNERELLSFAARTQEEVPFVRVAGTAQSAAGKQMRVEVALLWRDTPGATDASGALSKRIRVNGLPSRASEALGAVSAVLFTVDDLEIVIGPPAARRRFLDILLCQLEPAYLRALQRYQQVLLQRNHLLRMVRDGRSQAGELEFWDAELARHGATITERRAALLHELASLASELYAEVASGQEALGVSYQPSLTWSQADASTLVDVMLRSLAEGRKREVAAGQTLLGPHRDDVKFTVGGVMLAAYASRGQARGVALALRLAEARVIARVRGEEPVLLLDDLLSELDPARRRQVLAAAARADQAILTTADPDQFAEEQLASAPRFLVTPGAVALER